MRGKYKCFTKLTLWLMHICILLVIGSGVWASDAGKPNVLLIVCDDLNCDLGTYGHPLVKSPNIDSLAKSGFQFDQAHCQYPLCGPSRASFMTGLYPDQTLVQRNAIYIRERVPNVFTLPQAFRSAGYFATRIGKIYHYNVPKHIGTSGHDDPYSWNYTINPRGRDKTDESLIFSLRPGSFGGTLSWLAAEGDDEEQTDGIAALEAIERLEHHQRSGQPFFLAVGLYRPHTPYVAPKKYFDLYPLEKLELPAVPENYLDSLPAAAANCISRKKDQRNLPPSLAKQAMQAYYASISFADAQVGRILEELERLQLRQNTIVVFTSDHGYHMGEHGHWQKTTLFENATRVPLIISGPGIIAEGRSDVPVEMIDIYPTLTELCAISAPEYLAGQSLSQTLKGDKDSLRGSALTQFEEGYSLRTARYRFTVWGESGEQGVELYDHETDPAEMHNLAGTAEFAEIEIELSKALKTRVEAARQPPAGVQQILDYVPRNVPQPLD